MSDSWRRRGRSFWASVRYGVRLFVHLAVPNAGSKETGHILRRSPERERANEETVPVRAAVVRTVLMVEQGKTCVVQDFLECDSVHLRMNEEQVGNISLQR